MALNFMETNGSAAKSKVDLYEYKDGENSVRLVGGVLPRYVYWLPGTNGKDVPAECLSFDRSKERFTNVEKDHVLDYFPKDKQGKDNRPQWAYTVMCIDPKDGKVKPLPLKKKLFQNIIELAKDLGADPTDPDTGFDIVFRRAKTGPLPFNVEYTLAQMKCKQRPLTEEERAAVAEAKTIDEIYPRPTPEEIKGLMEKLTSGGGDSDNSDSGVDKEAAADL